MTLIYTADKEEIKLESEPLGKGGEGKVYRVVSPASHRNKCAKIFTIAEKVKEATKLNDSDRKKLQAKREKIAYMIKHPPTKLSGEHFRLCWPSALLYDDSRNFFGYLMPLSYENSISLYSIKPSNFDKNDKLPKVYKEKYSREKITGILNRAKLCTNISVAISLLHAVRVVIIDLKPENIQITHDGKISIIDVDSLQIKEKSGRYYKAEVETLEYSPPERLSGAIDVSSQPIEETWDRFACAVMFYEVLLGIHPFNASFIGPYEEYGSISEKIKRGLFVYGRYNRYLRPLPKDNPHWKFKKLPHPIQRLFLRTFVDGHTRRHIRPSISEYGREFFNAIISTETRK